MGQDLYLLSAPVFQHSEIDLGSSGRMLVIEALEATPGKGYVQKVTLNGKPLDRAWIHHHEIADGGVLNFKLGPRPGAWGKGHLPPSPRCGWLVEYEG